MVRFALPLTAADWQRQAGEELHAALDAGRCAAELIVRSAENAEQRELANAVSVALLRAQLAARRARW
jgi:hypothetical protein